VKEDERPEHIARMGEKNAYGVLVCKSEGERPLEKPRRRWVLKLKWILEE
jgi:hypothetical protein